MKRTKYQFLMLWPIGLLTLALSLFAFEIDALWSSKNDPTKLVVCFTIPKRKH